MMEKGEDCYADFRGRKPEAIVNHTIYIYHLLREAGGGPSASGQVQEPPQEGVPRDY